MDFLEGICILAPHPDDETMGCGQLIAEMCRRGGIVKVIVVSDGRGSHRNCCNIDESNIVEGRKASCIKAMEALGLPLENLVFLDYPDGELSHYEDEIFERVKELLGNSIYTLFVPHEQEGWSDHLAVYRVGKRIVESMGNTLYHYCVWFYFSMPFRKFNQVEWKSARILESSDACSKKRKALENYQNSKAPCGKPYAGVLPELLWKAVNDEREVYFDE